MITNSELLDAITAAITANAALFIPSDAGEGTTAEDLVISATHPAGYACLLSAPDFIAAAREAGDAAAPSDDVAEWVSACAMNGNFQAIIDAFPDAFEA